MPASTVTRVERPGSGPSPSARPSAAPGLVSTCTKPPCTASRSRGAIGLLHLDQAGHHVTDERRVTVEHRQCAFRRGHDHGGGAPGHNGLLGRDDLKPEDAVGH